MLKLPATLVLLYEAHIYFKDAGFFLIILLSHL